jgi:hypothetical protein
LNKENYYFNDKEIINLKEDINQYINLIFPVIEERQKAPYYLTIINDVVPELLKYHHSLYFFNLENQEKLNSYFNRIWISFLVIIEI